MDFQSNIKNAGEALRRSPFYRYSHLLGMWDRISFMEHKQQLVDSDAELSRDGKKIHLYPVLLRRTVEDSNYALLREFGKFVYAKASPELKKRWELKLVVPSKAQIDSFQSKLACRSFKSFKDLVEDYSCPCDRLVAVNISNAFLANRQPIVDAYEMDIRKYGPTCSYANSKRFHSTIPLVSAYSPRRIYEDFGEAFADAVAKNLRSVRHTSVQAVIRNILEDVIASTR